MNGKDFVDEILKDPNSLAHHGVLGMKWGVRRSRSGRVSSASKSKATQDKSEVKKKEQKKSSSTTKSAKDMDDAELRRVLNRIQMEKQYADLTKPKVSAGRKFAQEVLVGAAKQALTSYTSGIFKDLLDQAKPTLGPKPSKKKEEPKKNDE